MSMLRSLSALRGSAILSVLNSTGICMWLSEIGRQMICVTSACISMSSLTAFKVRLTTSSVFVFVYS